MLPNFLIIGAQKSGTTWLSWKLRQHPEVYMPEDEVHFFNLEDNYSKGIEWYKTLFSQASNKKAIGEKTPDYLATNIRVGVNPQKDIHLRIHEFLPDVNLIIVLRNPVERIISAVYHLIRMGHISPLNSIDELLVGSKKHLVEHFGAFEYGLYYKQIKIYLEHFNREEMLILIFEENIINQPNECLQKVCNFLKIDSSFEFKELDKRNNAYRHSWVHLVASYYIPLILPVTRRLNRFLPVYMPKPKGKHFKN